jgi:hypothetical protein
LKDDLRVPMQTQMSEYWTNGGKIKVGAHYDSYTFQGATIYIHDVNNLALMNIYYSWFSTDC